MLVKHDVRAPSAFKAVVKPRSPKGFFEPRVNWHRLGVKEGDRRRVKLWKCQELEREAKGAASLQHLSERWRKERRAGNSDSEVGVHVQTAAWEKGRPRDEIRWILIQPNNQ